MLVLYNMSNTNDKMIVELNDAKTFINEQYMDYEFLPNVKIFKVHQNNGRKNLKRIEKNNKR
tara:strand:- start:46 stop:231 length:186 start_codon:yes stop_codon:yes gene_type:complete